MAAAPAAAPTAPALQPVPWDALPGWREEDRAAAWSAFLRSCQALKNRVNWQEVCARAAALESTGPDSLQRFFEIHSPYRVVNPDGSDSRLITGYYEPLLKEGRALTRRFRFPVYGVPEDLLAIDLGELYPDLKSLRLRGRVAGNRVVPYFNRAQIEGGEAWSKAGTAVGGRPGGTVLSPDPGLGTGGLTSGEVVRLGYADQNGHPYKSIGKLLVERGELTSIRLPYRASRPGAARIRRNSRNSSTRTRAMCFSGIAERPAGTAGSSAFR